MNDETQPIRAIYTKSLWAAAYAITRGARLIAVYARTGKPPRNTFVLDNTDGIAHQAVDEWWTGDPLTHARALMNARLDLLDRIRTTELEAARVA